MFDLLGGVNRVIESAISLEKLCTAENAFRNRYLLSNINSFLFFQFCEYQYHMYIYVIPQITN